MASLRTGSKGEYYGSLWGESEPLTTGEMEVNAKYIYSFLYSQGWTLNSICALLGNMQAESSINPGRWQNDSVGNTSLGYSLVQWTPATKYINWCSENDFSDASEMDTALLRIQYEVQNGLQWIATSSYDFSFETFTKSDIDCSELAKAFLLNYERPLDQSTEVQTYRGNNAKNWYNFLQGFTPSKPVEKKAINKLLLYSVALDED